MNGDIDILPTLLYETAQDSLALLVEAFCSSCRGVGWIAQLGGF